MNDKTGDEQTASDQLNRRAVKEATSFGSAEPTDGREPYEWRSRYPEEAKKIIKMEAFILVGMLLFSFIFLFLTWTSTLESIVSICCEISNSTTFQKYCYFMLSGLLAGSIFSIKYLYHAVARGIWHIDRQLWRFMSPIISMGVAFVVGALVHSNLLNGNDSVIAPPTAVSIGFVSGYFSDSAIAKMYEIANVIFGHAKKPAQD